MAGTRFNGKLDVIILRLVAVSRSHESHYIGATFSSVECSYSLLSYLNPSTSMRSLS
jgi:hypothetical protein